LALSVGVWLAYAVILAVKWWRGLASLETARAAVIVFGLPVITLMMLVDGSRFSPSLVYCQQ
jgi:hypothetical protein